MKPAPLHPEAGDFPSGTQIERLMANGRALRSEAIRTMFRHLTDWIHDTILTGARRRQSLARQRPGIARRPLGPAGL